MFAVIRSGGKQYKVAKNDVIVVERLAVEPGATIALDEVLMLGEGADATTGAPIVDGAQVTATVLEQIRGEKVVVFKKKRRQNYRRTRGHRQSLTVLRVTDILAKGAKANAAAAKANAATAKAEKPAATAAKPAAADAAPAKKAPAKKTAPKKAAAKKTPAKKPAAKKPASKSGGGTAGSKE